MWPCWSIAPKMFWGLVWVVKGDSEVLLRLKFVFYKSYWSNISCVCTIVRLFTQLTELFTHILHCVVGSSVLLLTDRSDKSWFSRGVNINFVKLAYRTRNIHAICFSCSSANYTLRKWCAVSLLKFVSKRRWTDFVWLHFSTSVGPSGAWSWSQHTSATQRLCYRSYICRPRWGRARRWGR